VSTGVVVLRAQAGPADVHETDVVGSGLQAQFAQPVRLDRFATMREGQRGLVRATGGLSLIGAPEDPSRAVHHINQQ
jgi:hypothetical protein